MNTHNSSYLNAQLIQQALTAHQRGDINGATQLFEQALARDPAHPDALHFLGLIRHRADKSTSALKMVEESIRAAPKNPHFLTNMGAIYAESGDNENAMRCYRKALSILPSLAEAQNNLGNLYLTIGNPESALACFRKAATFKRGYIEPQRGIAQALNAMGKYNDARKHLEDAVSAHPNDPNLPLDLGLILFESGEKNRAMQVYETAVKANPLAVNVLMTYANSLRDDERLADAEHIYRQVLALEPMHIEALCFFADLLRRRRLLNEAEPILTAVTIEAPDNAIGHFCLGALRLDQNLFKEAITCFERVCELSPKWALAIHNLGAAHALAGDHSTAKRAYAKALALNPADVQPQLGIASSLALEGNIDDAIVAYQHAIKIDPGHYETYMGLFMAMQYSDQISSQVLFNAHQSFAKQFETPLISTWPIHTNSPDKDHRLRIGYVSGDLHHHAVAYFIEPILEKHDKRIFEVFCYANSMVNDTFTERIKKHAEHWTVCADITDDELFKKIQIDRIDILVDLSGHTAHNRLRVFARKPAPIQVTWIGYPGTTGMTAIDYRITDHMLDPVGVADTLHSEKLFRLAQMNAAFRPPMEKVPVSSLPAITSGSFTFASLNGAAKTSRRVISLWSRILQRIPNAKLIIGNADAPAYIERLKTTFAEFGVNEQRISFHPRVPMTQFLNLHNQIDLCLDTLPYNGATTTLLGLWMGVPAITVAGHTTSSRCGVSILSQLGLTDFIATTDDEYVELAVRIANDLPALASLRMNLRALLEVSAGDANRATGLVESAYREMWGTWCDSQTIRTS